MKVRRIKRKRENEWGQTNFNDKRREEELMRRERNNRQSNPAYQGMLGVNKEKRKKILFVKEK